MRLGSPDEFTRQSMAITTSKGRFTATTDVALHKKQLSERYEPTAQPRFRSAQKISRNTHEIASNISALP
jgi:hypothetical protein